MITHSQLHFVVEAFIMNFLNGFYFWQGAAHQILCMHECFALRQRVTFSSGNLKFFTRCFPRTVTASGVYPIRTRESQVRPNPCRPKKILGWVTSSQNRI